MISLKKSIISALLALCVLLSLFSGCSKKQATDGNAPEIKGLEYESTLQLEYADQFAVYKYKGGYAYIDIKNSDKMLVVPEGGSVPEGLERDVVVVQQPLSDIYMAATSPMALFDALDALGNITFVGTKQWYTENAIAAMQNGSFIYAGKYNAPDYELLINSGCQLALESTMILHNPEVKEKMLELGIKTVVERSSYEEHPLGRTEWIKLYGVLLGKEAEAKAVFDGEVAKIKALESLENTGKTVAFFYVNASGNVVTYKSEGYLPAMIELAGGRYIPDDIGVGDTGNLSTVNMNMEEFYYKAQNADVIIYNCSIAAQLHSLAEFFDLSPVLKNFSAVQSGNVWCTSRSLFQQTDKTGTIIQEMNAVLTGEAENGGLEYIFKLT